MKLLGWKTKFLFGGDEGKQCWILSQSSYLKLLPKKE